MKSLPECFDYPEQDQELMKSWIDENLVTDSVASFVSGPGIQKINITFDIKKLRDTFEDARNHILDVGDGFMAIPITRRPGMSTPTETDMIGRYYMRPDATYKEMVLDALVD